MKISEFLSKYLSCPICDRKIDSIFNVHFTKTFNYSLQVRLDNVFEFIKVKEESVHSRGGTKRYYKDYNTPESSYMPATFSITDKFIIPDGIVNLASGPLYGRASFKIECAYNDFICTSTDFNVFDDNQIVDIYSEGFEINWNRIVYNDYEKGKTTIRIINSINASGNVKSKELNLIPLDKWPLGDKIKMKEKIDKLLVLI